MLRFLSHLPLVGFLWLHLMEAASHSVAPVALSSAKRQRQFVQQSATETLTPAPNAQLEDKRGTKDGRRNKVVLVGKTPLYIGKEPYPHLMTQGQWRSFIKEQLCDFLAYKIDTNPEEGPYYVRRKSDVSSPQEAEAVFRLWVEESQPNMGKYNHSRRVLTAAYLPKLDEPHQTPAFARIRYYNPRPLSPLKEVDISGVKLRMGQAAWDDSPLCLHQWPASSGELFKVYLIRDKPSQRRNNSSCYVRKLFCEDVGRAKTIFGEWVHYSKPDEGVFFASHLYGIYRDTAKPSRENWQPAALRASITYSKTVVDGDVCLIEMSDQIKYQVREIPTPAWTAWAQCWHLRRCQHYDWPGASTCKEFHGEVLTYETPHGGNFLLTPSCWQPLSRISNQLTLEQLRAVVWQLLWQMDYFHSQCEVFGKIDGSSILVRLSPLPKAVLLPAVSAWYTIPISYAEPCITADPSSDVRQLFETIRATLKHMFKSRNAANTDLLRQCFSFLERLRAARGAWWCLQHEFFEQLLADLPPRGAIPRTQQPGSRPQSASHDTPTRPAAERSTNAPCHARKRSQDSVIASARKRWPRDRQYFPHYSPSRAADNSLHSSPSRAADNSHKLDPRCCAAPAEIQEPGEWGCIPRTEVSGNALHVGPASESCCNIAPAGDHVLDGKCLTPLESLIDDVDLGAVSYADIMDLGFDFNISPEAWEQLYNDLLCPA